MNPSNTLGQIGQDSPSLEYSEVHKYKPEKSLSRFRGDNEIKLKITTRRAKKSRKMSKDTHPKSSNISKRCNKNGMEIIAIFVY